MRVLVLGGTGFLGRHVAAALEARGHAVTIGLRRARRARPRPEQAAHRRNWRVTPFEQLTDAKAWDAKLDGIDAVVNCVGILRERGRETYRRVHCEAPAALASACARRGIARLVHVSALGLHDAARSGFVRSKLAAERALVAFGDAVSIVRPSLLAGEGGYGAKWIARAARWALHCVPANAIGRIAVVDVRDVGEAIAILCTAPGGPEWQEVEMGGAEMFSIADYLSALRAAACRAPARRIVVPAGLARFASHVCDLFHASPFSFGHLELLRRDNVANPNRLPVLLGRAPRSVVAPASASLAPAAVGWPA